MIRYQNAPIGWRLVVAVLSMTCATARGITVLEFTSSTYEVEEGTGIGIQLVASPPPTQPILFSLTRTAGTADAFDYQYFSPFSFPAGTNAYWASLSVIDDGRAESDETATFALLIHSPDVQVGNRSETVVTVHNRGPHVHWSVVGGGTEAEPLILWGVRGGDTNVEVGMQYSLTGAGSAGSAGAGAPTLGQVWFAAGEVGKPLTLPVIDNGTLDDETDTKSLAVAFTNLTPGLVIDTPALRLRIVDNEAPQGLDFNYSPVVPGVFDGISSPGTISAAYVQSDGKLLALTGSDDFERTRYDVFRFRVDGSLDSDFSRAWKTNFSEISGAFLMADSTIWVQGVVDDPQGAGQDRHVRRVRLASDGTVLGPVADLGICCWNRLLLAWPLASAPDGKWYAWRLVGGDGAIGVVRFNADFSVDPTFQALVTEEPILGAVAQADGRIIAALGPTIPEDVVVLKRWNLGGAPDTGFASRRRTCYPWSLKISALTEGRIILSGLAPDPVAPEQGRPFIERLDSDGHPDPTFRLDPRLRDPVLVGVVPDGRLHVAVNGVVPCTSGVIFENLPYALSMGLLRFYRLNPDGGIDDTFIPAVQRQKQCNDLSTAGEKTLSAPDGSLILYNNQTRVNHSANPVVRISGRGEAGVESFAWTRNVVVAPDSASVSLSVYRTGDTSKPASVAFVALDGTAEAGREFRPQSGRLEFAPLEVERSVRWELIDGAHFEGHRDFQVVLREPSAGYRIGDPTATVWVVSKAFRFVPGTARMDIDGSFVVMVQQLLPFQRITGEATTDFVRWVPVWDVSRPERTFSFQIPTEVAGEPWRFFRLIGTPAEF